MESGVVQWGSDHREPAGAAQSIEGFRGRAPTTVDDEEDVAPDLQRGDAGRMSVGACRLERSDVVAMRGSYSLLDLCPTDLAVHGDH